MTGSRAQRSGLDLGPLEAALRSWEASPLEALIRSVPPDVAATPADLAAAGVGLFDDRLTFPQMTISWPAVSANVAIMQRFCDSADAWLAPHGKTTMAPHIFEVQLRAGAWAITVATARQALTCRAFGIPRVIVANEITHRGEIRRLVSELATDQTFELMVLVDDPGNAGDWAAAARAAQLDRPVQLLVEHGFPNGRTGTRDRAGLGRVVDAIVDGRPWVELFGIEGYEGIAPWQTAEEREEAAIDYLDSLAAAARRILPRLTVDRPLVSAGGSVYFDRVVERLGRSALPDFQLVLRSGGYVTHDDGYYQRVSPLSSASDRLPGRDRLRPALVLWGVTLSRPEQDLAILGFGHRDAPSRIDPPVARWHAGGGTVTEIEPGVRIRRMDDQHAYLDLGGRIDPAIGDFVGGGISHPCEAFERWRVMLALNDARRVVGLIPTFF